MATYSQSAPIQSLFMKGQPMSFGKGDIILGNEAEPDGVYYIGTGYIKIYAISEEGEELLQVIYGPGEIFPLFWAYLGVEADTLFYEGLSDCTLWRISRQVFTEYAKGDAALSYTLSTQLARQCIIYAARIDNLERKKASERVAYRLLLLANHFGSKTETEITIELPLTHEIFANSINLARESVSREIEKLERQHILRKENHHVIITDLKALQQNAGQPGNFAVLYELSK